jgi:hypothetical protein
MIWFRYTRCLTTMTKSYGLLISQVGIQYQTPKEKYISMLITENAAGGIKED